MLEPSVRMGNGDEAASGCPRVSVIIPCFNLGEYIDEAVDSVLAQTVDRIEIVIVNDGSTDAHTNERLRDYCRPNTRVITTGNRGLAAARNLGIGVARGEYVCALDADDKIAPTYLEKAVAALDANPHLAFVSSWLETFGAEQWVWKQSRCDLPTLLGECTVSTAALVRLSALHTVGGFDEHMPDQGYEDWDLWISLVERGFTGTILPEILFYYRRRPGSMSSICCSGEVHLRLLRYLVEKHATSYERHFLDVMSRKEADTAELLRANADLERHLEEWVEPEIRRRTEELELLRRKLAEADAMRNLHSERDRLLGRIAELDRMMAVQQVHVADVERSLSDARAEVEQLKASKSWKITAPARAVYELMQRRS